MRSQTVFLMSLVLGVPLAGCLAAEPMGALGGVLGSALPGGAGPEASLGPVGERPGGVRATGGSVQVLEFRGYYHCAFGTLILIDSCTFPARTGVQVLEQVLGEEILAHDDLKNQREFFWDARPGVEAVVQELVWEQSPASTTDRMRLYLARPPIDPVLDSSPEYMTTDGVSPIRQVAGNLSANDTESYRQAGYDAASPRMLRVGETLTRVYLPFDDVPTVAVDQPFTVYVSVFYGTAPEPGYTAIPAE